MTERPLPEPLYSCHDEDCRIENSYPAADLTWSDGLTKDDCETGAVAHEAGWYCDQCIDTALGPSLVQELRERG